MEIEAALMRFIAEEVGQASGETPPLEEPLIASGRIDSLGLLQVIGFIQQQWRVDLMATGTPEDLVSVASMATAVRRHVGD